MLKRTLALVALTVALASATSAAALREAGFYGITAPMYYPGAGYIFTAQVADNLNELGVRWVRMEILKEGYDTINYAGYDQAVDAAAARGISVLGLIDYTSLYWYSSSEWGSPAFRARFVARVGEIVSHFTPRIRAWEIWNEEDSTFYVEPNAYAALLRESYEAIKGIDPSATVVLGGLSSAWPSSGNYLRALYQSDAFSDIHPMDAVAVHPYNWTAGPYTYLADALRGNIKAVMDDYGDEAMKLWLTEIGWNVCGQSPTCVAPGQSQEYCESLQGLFIGQLLYLAAGLTDDAHPEYGHMVEKVFVYNYGDWGTEWFGLVRPDGTKRPSFYSYKERAGGPVTEATAPSALASGWNLICLPLVPDDPAPGAVLSACVDAGNTLEGNLYAYGGAYAVYPGDFDLMEVGRGYWLRLDVPARPSYWGTQAPAPISIPLAGWTLVGLPRTHAVRWADVEVTDGSTTLSVPQAAAAGWIQERAFWYDGAAYRTLAVSGGDDDFMRPWRGTWVLAEREGLRLVIP